MHVPQDLTPSLQTTPQPVALALGRVVRALGLAERLDACIKASEVVARYVAAAGLASAAATRPASCSPIVVAGFVGNLSFGTFEKAARGAFLVDWEHPLRKTLRLSLRSTRRHPALAGQRLEEFVQLRNQLGHSITPADESVARSVFERADPIGALVELVAGLDGVLSLPLLVTLRQQHRRGRLLSSLAFFAGEGEPIPQEIELTEPLFEWEVPYLCTPEGLLPMSPGLIYAPKSSDGRLGLHLLDAVSEGGLRYKSVQDGGVITSSEGVSDLGSWLQLPVEAGGPPRSRPALERIHCPDGRTLHGYLSGASPEHEHPVEETGEPTGIGTRLPPIGLGHFSSVREFEHRLSTLGLGSGYRDVLYALVARGAHVEVNGPGVRVISTDQSPQILATLELTPAAVLAVVLFGSAPGGESAVQTEAFVLEPYAPADQIVERIAAAG